MKAALLIMPVTFIQGHYLMWQLTWLFTCAILRGGRLRSARCSSSLPWLMIHAFQSNVLQSVSSFYWLYLKNVLQMFLFGSLTHVTSNRRVHFMSKSCGLSERMGSENCDLVGCCAASCGNSLNLTGKWLPTLVTRNNVHMHFYVIYNWHI